MAKILIVDDSSTIRLLLTRFLQHHGHSIETGENGNQAIEKYKFFKPDVLFIDSQMPEKDGIPAIQEIISFDPNAKIIFLTGETEKEKAEEALNAGAKTFLKKPCENQDILLALDKLQIN